MFTGSEISIAVAHSESCTAVNNCTLYMNGRGGKQFEPYRTDYWSYDNGASWSTGSKNRDIKDDAGSGCEGSVINYEDTLYFLEPEGPKRTGMQLHCSKDQGKSWKSSKNVNGENRGGYRCVYIHRPPYVTDIVL